MPDIQRKKNTGESTTNGGHFGSRANDPAAVTLAHSERNTVRSIGGDHELLTHDELPEWPASIPKPEVSMNFDGGVRTDFWFKDEDDTGFGVEFWDAGEHSGIVNSIDDAMNGSWPASWSDEDQEAAAEWMAQVAQNIDADVYGLSISAMRDTVEDAVLANAQGLRHNPYEGLTLVEASVKRVSDTYGGTIDSPSDFASVLADLRHYAAAKGIDFEDAADTAKEAFEDEKK